MTAYLFVPQRDGRIPLFVISNLKFLSYPEIGLRVLKQGPMRKKKTITSSASSYSFALTHGRDGLCCTDT